MKTFPSLTSELSRSIWILHHQFRARKKFILPAFVRWSIDTIKSFLGAVVFYTTIPLPSVWVLDFERIARWAPLIGIIIGGILGLIDEIVRLIGIPRLTCGVLLVGIWVVLTGGLHLDGAIDTADGLAVPQQERRLEVMKDSVTGAFGVMAAVILLLLKTASLSEIQCDRWLALMISAGWGRWGQVLAISFYPYLRPTGKGAFHKNSFRFPQDILFGLLCLLGLSVIQLFANPHKWWIAIGTVFAGCAIATLTGFWLYVQLGGHTGDTYGAVVEWTEALLLCLFTSLFH